MLSACLLCNGLWVPVHCITQHVHTHSTLRGAEPRLVKGCAPGEYPLDSRLLLPMAGKERAQSSAWLMLLFICSDSTPWASSFAMPITQAPITCISVLVNPTPATP